jgi:hypothetical protein
MDEAGNPSGNEVTGNRETKRLRLTTLAAANEEEQYIAALDITSNEQLEILNDVLPVGERPLRDTQELWCPCCEFAFTELSYRVIISHLEKAHRWFQDVIDDNGHRAKLCCVIDDHTGKPCGHSTTTKYNSEGYRQAGRHLGSKHSRFGKPYFCRIGNCKRAFTRRETRGDHRRTVHKLDSRATEAALRSDEDIKFQWERFNISRGLMEVPWNRKKIHAAYVAMRGNTVDAW